MRTLRKGIEDYVAMKRVMGFSFGQQESCLLRFCGFLEVANEPHITTDLAKKWALGTDKEPTYIHAKKLAAIRPFAMHWQTIEANTEVWAEDTWDIRYKRVAPYIYTQKEITAILDACLKLELDDTIRPLMFHTLFGLIASCGLRLSEALKLKIDDVDFKLGPLTIRKTKFNKIRIIPVHVNTIKALKKYWDLRQKLHPNSKIPEFFISHYDRAIKSNMAEWTFDKVAVTAGVRKESRRGARIHDFRHTFIMRTIEGWYREGKNIEELLPILSTYVGHANPGSTYWYMTLTPELMEFAKDKLDTYMGGLSE